MILRTWHGRTRLSDADAYERFLIETAVPDYKRVEGLRQLYFTRRDEETAAHFLLVTVWDSLKSVEQFAGDQPQRAKYYPEDDRYLLEKELHSFNHDIFHAEPAFASRNGVGA